MSSRTLSMVGIVISLVGLGVAGPLGAQPSPETVWTLPHGKAEQDLGRRTYRFAVDYHSANARGEILQHDRLIGDYSRGLPDSQVMWKNVTHAVAPGDAVIGEGERVEFMEGLRYRNRLDTTLAPDFFKGFPPTAVMERNLVWDTGMLELFGQRYFDQLDLNRPFRPALNGDVDMPGVGHFTNREIELQWIGQSRRNGQACAIILYQAFFNRLNIDVGDMHMKGRSDYWGEIWVSMATHQIEYGTLHETVVAEMQLPGQATPQLVNVLRIGSFEPVDHD